MKRRRRRNLAPSDLDRRLRALEALESEEHGIELGRCHGIGEEGWTPESIHETARSFRELVYAWQWPASVLEEYDTPNNRRDLRLMRERAQRAVDAMTRLADREANAGRIPTASNFLGIATTLWGAFEAQADGLQRGAEETTLETAERVVAEMGAGVREASQIAADAAVGAGLGAGAGIALVALGALFLLRK